jgi:hypothetical protein
MKLCTDCKHHYEDDSIAAYMRGTRHLCGVEGQRDPVTGVPMYRLCKWMRSSFPAGANGAPTCNPEGKRFEARE